MLFEMDVKPNICELLKERILAYTAVANISLAGFSTKSRVPLAIIQRIVSGNFVAVKFHHAYQILNLIDPDNVKPFLVESFLVEFYSHYFLEAHRHLGFERNAEAHDSVLSRALKSKILYNVYSMASTTHGVSLAKVEDVLKKPGLQALHELVGSGVLVEVSEGLYKDPLFNHHQTNEAQLCQMIKYNLEDFEPHNRYAAIFNIVEGYSDKGLEKVRNIIRKLFVDIFEVASDSANLGTETLFFSTLCGPIPSSQALIVKTTEESNNSGSDKEIGEFLAGLVHDMRVPMKYVQQVLDEQSEDKQAPIEISRAKSAARRIEGMIDALRRFENYEVVSRQMESFNFDQILNFANAMADKYGKRFSYNGPAEFHGSLDKVKIDRIIQNLLMNAFQAATTAINLECILIQDSMRLRVIDDGEGVPLELAPKIFELGFSFGKPEGSGLGLSNVKTIAQAHDGDAFYERLNGQTVFTVILQNVFVDSVLEDHLKPVALADQPLRVRGEEARPILFVAASDLEVQLRLLAAGAEHLQKFHVSEDADDMLSAYIVCTDNVSLALEAANAGISRILTPSTDLIARSDFITSLVKFANDEIGKFPRLESKPQ